MGVKHEAFLDLEQMLLVRLISEWRKYWKSFEKDIDALLLDSKFDDVSELIDTLDLSVIVERVTPFVKSITNSSLLLGASRVVPVKSSSILKEVPEDKKDNSVAQFSAILTSAMAKSLQTLAKKKLASLELSEAVIKTDGVGSTAFRVSISSAAGEFLQVASSLHVSRLSTFGFLLEAAKANHQYYEVLEILDDVICPVCREMHGKVFPIDAGLNHANTIMGTPDPEDLRAVAPWPKNTPQSVSALSKLSTSDLISQGLTLPPYHPRCRGIVGTTSKSVDVGSFDLTQALVGAASAIAAGSLTSFLFGDQEDS